MRLLARGPWTGLGDGWSAWDLGRLSCSNWQEAARRRARAVAGDTMSVDLDMVKLRELAAEFGFWPATTDPDDIERHREHNKNADFWLARSHRFDHLARRTTP
jgi:hypothetical protein